MGQLRHSFVISQNGISLDSMEPDFLRYYDLETYLWEDVHRRFHTDGGIGAFDFFSIVVWKSNRAKSKIAARLLEHGHPDLDEAARGLRRTSIRPKTRRGGSGSSSIAGASGSRWRRQS